MPRARSAALAAPPPAAGAGARDPVREQLAVRLVDADAQIASLERQLRELEIQSNRLEEMARNAPEVQAQFANLDRDYNIIRRNYEELLSRREAVNIAEAARTGTDRVTLDVVDPPTMPASPTGPKRLLLAAGVLLAAFGAGGALLFLLVQLDTSFYTLRELRGVGLTVLGALSGSTRHRLRKGDVGAPHFSACCHFHWGSSLPRWDHATSWQMLAA